MVSSPAFLAVLSLLSAPFALAQTCTPCEDVHFFLARGNNEPYPGRQGDLVAATCDGLSSCGYEDLIYSALYTDLSCQTTYDGTLAGFSQLTAYAERCPDSKLILAGYSQGAQIVTDILGGGGGKSFNDCIQPSTPALDPKTSPGNRIAAVIVFGNTRHTANQPYNFGNGSAYDGLYPRSGAMLTALDSYADVTRDWCLETDPICADGQPNALVSTHLSYYNVYSDAAASWIKSVASLTDNSNHHTSIPTSISGTAQDYSTIGSFTPSGTVKTAATTDPVVVCGNSTVAAVAAATPASLSATNITQTSTSLSTSKPPFATDGANSTASISTTPRASIASASTTPRTSGASAPNSTDISSYTSGSNSHVGNLGLVLFLTLLISIIM